MRFTTTATALAAALPLTLGQTFTSCDPTKRTCPANTGLPASSYSADFTQGAGANASWSAAAYTTVDYTNEGAVFSIAQKGQAPTIATNFFIFFGRVDVTMKAAPGQGIVSSIVLQSDVLDEIDWEFVGGDNAQVQSNFFGKGNTTTYDRVVYHNVQTPQDTFHTYSIDWTSERLEFLIDGTVIRTVPYSDPKTAYGQNYPQTPMQLKLGSWPGGDAESEGTVQWAGGKVDYSQAPFDMVVKKVTISNANPGCQYKYSDMSGSWESIDVITSGDSCEAEAATSTGATTKSAVGSATASSVQSTATIAPTSSQEVKNIENTAVVVSSTVTGSAYSTNSASVSALNTGFQTAATGANSTMVTTGRPSPTSGPIVSTGGATLNRAVVGGSLLSVILGLSML